jgi:hypothetical protein
MLDVWIELVRIFLLMVSAQQTQIINLASIKPFATKNNVHLLQQVILLTPNVKNISLLAL